MPKATGKRKAARNRQPEAVAAWSTAILEVAELLGASAPPEAQTDLATQHEWAVERSLEELFRMCRGQSNDDPASERFAQIETATPLTPELLAFSYERVLDYAPDRVDGIFRLAARDGLRKSSGRYFTPPTLIAHLLDATLKPTLDARIRQELSDLGNDYDPSTPPADWPSAVRERAEQALLSIRVCDPTCGPGGFLVAAAEYLADRLVRLRDPSGPVRPADRRRAYVDVIQRCIYGVDLDDRAIAIARISLWLAAGRPEIDPGEIAPNLCVGDSLAVPDDAARQRIALADPQLPGWAGRFPEVFAESWLFASEPARDALRGFDVVLGNPPFANAIEGMVNDATKRWLTKIFPEIIGTADLAYFFLALSHRLTRPDGAVGLLLPRGVLTGRSAAELRRELLAERPPALIYAPQDQNLFPGANVFVVLLALRCGDSCVGSRDRRQPRFEPIRVHTENWWAPLIDDSATPVAELPVLGESFEVFASMTTGMAYDLVPYVSDKPIRDALKLVTTGLIDPGHCLWGERTCRYLGRKYSRPAVRERAGLPAAIQARLEKVRRPKVLVAGLSTRIEAFLDDRGEYCGAVSTYTILHPQDDVSALSQVRDYLNSVTASRLLQLWLGAHAMGGGRITLNKRFLHNLPFS